MDGVNYMTNIGRPTLYNEELAKEITDAIATTPVGLRKLCAKNEHWPERQTIYNWRRAHPTFFDQYARAREESMDLWAEEAWEIAQDKEGDSYTDDKGNIRCDHEWVHRSRLKIDCIKWFTSKLAPKKYGDKNTTELELSLLEKLTLQDEKK